MQSKRLLDQKTFNESDKKSSDKQAQKIFDDPSTSYIIASHLSLKDLASFSRVGKSSYQGAVNATVLQKDKLIKEWKREYTEETTNALENSMFLGIKTTTVSGKQRYDISLGKINIFIGSLTPLTLLSAGFLLGNPLGALFCIAISYCMANSLYTATQTENLFVQKLGVFARINDQSLYAIKKISPLNKKHDEKAVASIARNKI